MSISVTTRSQPFLTLGQIQHGGQRLRKILTLLVHLSYDGGESLITIKALVVDYISFQDRMSMTSLIVGLPGDSFLEGCLGHSGKVLSSRWFISLYSGLSRWPLLLVSVSWILLPSLSSLLSLSPFTLLLNPNPHVSFFFFRLAIWEHKNLAGTYTAPLIKGVYGAVYGLIQNPICAMIAMGSEDSVRHHRAERQRQIFENPEKSAMTTTAAERVSMVAGRNSVMIEDRRSSGRLLLLDQHKPGPKAAVTRTTSTTRRVDSLRRSLDGVAQHAQALALSASSPPSPTEHQGVGLGWRSTDVHRRRSLEAPRTRNRYDSQTPTRSSTITATTRSRRNSSDHSPSELDDSGESLDQTASHSRRLVPMRRLTEASIVFEPNQPTDQAWNNPKKHLLHPLVFSACWSTTPHYLIHFLSLFFRLPSPSTTIDCLTSFFLVLETYPSNAFYPFDMMVHFFSQSEQHPTFLSTFLHLLIFIFIYVMHIFDKNAFDSNTLHAHLLLLPPTPSHLHSLWIKNLTF